MPLSCERFANTFDITLLASEQCLSNMKVGRSRCSCNLFFGQLGMPLCVDHHVDWTTLVLGEGGGSGAMCPHLGLQRTGSELKGQATTSLDCVGILCCRVATYSSGENERAHVHVGQGQKSSCNLLRCNNASQIPNPHFWKLFDVYFVQLALLAPGATSVPLSQRTKRGKLNSSDSVLIRSEFIRLFHPI